MSGYAKYREKRSSWGIGVLGSLVVEIETEDGTIGVATGSGGVPAAWLIKQPFRRFLVGEDARNINRIWDEMYRASLPYGRKGLPIMAISAVDLALWDLDRQGARRAGLQSDRRAEPRRDHLLLHRPGARRDQGAWASGAPRCRCRMAISTARRGSRPNVAFLRRHRDSGRAGFPADGRLLHVADRRPMPSASPRPASDLDIYWWEEVLSPDDVEGYPPDQAGAPDAQMDDRRARIYPLRLPPADRGAHHRHPAARRDVGRRHDRAAAHRGARRGLRHAGGAAWQRALFLPLHRQPDRPGLLRIRRGEPRRADRSSRCSAISSSASRCRRTAS